MYVNKNDFSCIQHINQLRQDDYFYVDDLIGLTVATLNKKGYKTLGSCSGHACLTDMVLDINCDYRGYGELPREVYVMRNKEAECINIVIAMLNPTEEKDNRLREVVENKFILERCVGVTYIKSILKEANEISYYDRVDWIVRKNRELYELVCKL